MVSKFNRWPKDYKPIKRMAVCHPDKPTTHTNGLCEICNQKLWRKNNPEKSYNKSMRHHYMREYGLTIDQVQIMEERQGGLCLICKQAKKLVVDHCHETGVVRGLLCKHCNTGIGLFKEDIQILESAIGYLKSNHDV